MANCAACQRPWTEWMSLCEEWFCTIECLVKHSAACTWCAKVRELKEGK